MANKSKIKISDLDRMIMEEMNKIKKANEIKAKLSIVQEELKRLKESESMDEVEVGGTRNGSEYYEKGTPVAKFEKIGTHLKEDEPVIGDDQVPQTFEEKLAAIGRELDMKLSSMDDDVEATMGDEAGDDEIEIDAAASDEMDMAADDAGAEDAEGAEGAEDAAVETGDDAEGEDEEKEGDEIEIDEASIEVEKAGDPFDKKPEEGMNKMDHVGTKTVSEEKEEKEEEKETMEEEKTSINESRDVLGKKANPLLAKELDRMRKLANL